VAHALTTYDAACDFNTTLVTHDALVTNTLVLAAVTLVVALRTKDFFIKESVLLTTLSAVVDSLWLRDFTTTPRENLFRTRKR
jgi:hypothetical protein